MLSLEAKIESVLFFRGEPTSIKKLAELLGASQEEIRTSLSLLEKKYVDGGLTLVYSDDEVLLATSPDASAIIEQITKDELTRDLGKAGLETLSIILYKHPISRREIDYIRGVNSSFIVRNLLIRGLIEKADQKEGRGYNYKPTIELLSYMGLMKIEDLPEYENVLREFEEFNRKESGSEDTVTPIPEAYE